MTKPTHYGHTEAAISVHSVDPADRGLSDANALKVAALLRDLEGRMTTALDRWRERCGQHVAQNKDAPHYEHRRIGIRLGVERALSYDCDTPGTLLAFCIDREDYRQSTETVCVGSPASFVCEGLRLALRWLREEIARGE